MANGTCRMSLGFLGLVCGLTLATTNGASNEAKVVGAIVASISILLLVWGYIKSGPNRPTGIALLHSPPQVQNAPEQLEDPSRSPLEVSSQCSLSP